MVDGVDVDWLLALDGIFTLREGGIIEINFVVGSFEEFVFSSVIVFWVFNGKG